MQHKFHPDHWDDWQSTTVRLCRNFLPRTAEIWNELSNCPDYRMAVFWVQILYGTTLSVLWVRAFIVWRHRMYIPNAEFIFFKKRKKRNNRLKISSSTSAYQSPLLDKGLSYCTQLFRSSASCIQLLLASLHLACGCPSPSRQRDLHSSTWLNYIEIKIIAKPVEEPRALLMKY